MIVHALSDSWNIAPPGSTSLPTNDAISSKRNFVTWMSINLYKLRTSAASTRPSASVRLSGLAWLDLLPQWLGPSRVHHNCDTLPNGYAPSLQSVLEPLSAPPGVFFADVAQGSVATIQPTFVVVPELYAECSSDRLLGGRPRNRRL